MYTHMNVATTMGLDLDGLHGLGVLEQEAVFDVPNKLT